MRQVVLCGDSIFDNKAYVVPGEPDVVAQVRERLGPDDRATLLAVDGSVTADVPDQLARLPDDATHVVISTGGNDALGHLDLLEQPAASFGEVLDALAQVRDSFLRTYRAMVETALLRRLPTVLCTVYEPRFARDPSRLEDLGLGLFGAPEGRSLQRRATAALTVFNDVIVREAVRAGCPLIELRSICSEDADFANPIEPSARGGAKIAAAIARVVEEHDFGRGRCEVFG